VTEPEFSEVFAMLALQLRASDADTPTIRAYYRVMKDLEIELVRLSAVHLAKHAEWFPKSSEWIEATQSIERQRSFQLADTLRQLHRRGVELCTICGDTGWNRDANECVTRCLCQNDRRLEVIGRRQLPGFKALLRA